MKLPCSILPSCNNRLEREATHAQETYCFIVLKRHSIQDLTGVAQYTLDGKTFQQPDCSHSLNKYIMNKGELHKQICKVKFNLLKQCFCLFVQTYLGGYF